MIVAIGAKPKYIHILYERKVRSGAISGAFYGGTAFILFLICDI